jgi:hypothetical protein
MMCRSCAAGLEEVFDLGKHYLPDFTAPVTPHGKPWPLRLAVCIACGLAQLCETTPRNELYHDRYGFKSGLSDAVKTDLHDVVRYSLEALEYAPATWLDIASNDGTLMSYVPQHVECYGIDPLRQFAEEARMYGDIVSDYFSPRYYDHGMFDVIT